MRPRHGLRCDLVTVCGGDATSPRFVPKNHHCYATESLFSQDSKLDSPRARWDSPLPPDGILFSDQLPGTSDTAACFDLHVWPVQRQPAVQITPMLPPVIYQITPMLPPVLILPMLPPVLKNHSARFTSSQPANFSAFSDFHIFQIFIFFRFSYFSDVQIFRFSDFSDFSDFQIFRFSDFQIFHIFIFSYFQIFQLFRFNLQIHFFFWF